MKPVIDVAHASVSESADIARVYNQGIESRTATFETRLRTEEDIGEWFDEAQLILTARIAGKFVGFASVFGYSARECYRGVGEFSVYVDSKWQARGVGRVLMTRLIKEAAAREYWKILSRVFPENGACLSLLDSVGFRRVGEYRKHGKLDGAWRDVVIVERWIGYNACRIECAGAVPEQEMGVEICPEAGFWLHCW